MIQVTRRNFFGKAIAAIAGFIALGLSVPILGYTILPALRKREEPWSEVGPVAQLETNQPKELDVVRSVSSGWMKSASVKSVWAFRKPEGDVVVYSPICTHVGCGYHWDDQEKKFLCPCHNSVFDLKGQVLGGAGSQTA